MGQWGTSGHHINDKLHFLFRAMAKIFLVDSGRFAYTAVKVAEKKFRLCPDSAGEYF